MSRPTRSKAIADLSHAMDEFQRACIVRALEQHSGNVSKAAKALRMDKASLQRQIKRLGIQT